MVCEQVDDETEKISPHLEPVGFEYPALMPEKQAVSENSQGKKEHGHHAHDKIVMKKDRCNDTREKENQICTVHEGEKEIVPDKGRAHFQQRQRTRV